MNFFGREHYLNDLAALYEKSSASLVACKGRRRIGKSTLFEEFASRSEVRFIEIAGKAPHPAMTNEEQLQNFETQLCEQCGRKKVEAISDWQSAFIRLDEQLDGRKTLVLLDEVSWMGREDPGFASDFKTIWDKRLKKHDKLVVVLCGSVSTWIEKNILNNTGFAGRLSLDLTVEELPLRDCVRFWGRKARRIGSREILDVLSVTGGVPRYLEEMNPSLSADENIRRMCFHKEGLLRNDFERIFSSVFGESAIVKRRILETLASGSLGLSEISAAMKMERGGLISDCLHELSVAGFVAADNGLNPATGKPAKCIRYRICDNYTRFYLKYIRANAASIDRNMFRYSSLAQLPGWETILGLQFENLLLSNVTALLPRLGLEGTLITSAAPWRQKPTRDRKGCQVDLLIQSERCAYIVEMKRRKELDISIEDEVEAKVRALALPRGTSIRTALVYDGEISPRVAARGYFDALIPVTELLTV